MARAQRKGIILLLAVIAATGAYALRHGDLLFVAAARTSFEKAISASTASIDTVYSHVAIVDMSDPANPAVIEAEPRHGVHSIPLHEFVDSTGHDAFIVAKRIVDIDSITASRAVDRARALIGRPYDFAFEPGDSAVYCSELVWLSYVDADAHPLFKATPMRFDDPSDHPGYWAEYYARLGRPVPHNADGTHPSTMARSAILQPTSF